MSIGIGRESSRRILCIAHQALNMIDEVYVWRENQNRLLDTEAQTINDRFNNQDPEIRNLRTVH